MRNTLLVIRHEILSLLGKRSFWLMTFLFPLLIMALNIGTQILSQRAFEEEQAKVGEGPSQVVGYVDPGGLIAALPEDVPEQVLRAYPDEAAAKAALSAGQIARYYVIPADWIETGSVVMVDRTFRPLGGQMDGNLIEYLLAYNLTGDRAVATLLLDPTLTVTSTALAPRTTTDRDSPLAYWVAFGTMFILLFSLTMSSGLVLQSVAKEKESRTAEVLLLSLHPRELMLGKLVGLGLVALLQLAVWAGGSLLFLNRGRQIVAALSSFALPPGFIAWFVAYFVFAFAAYASALGAIGVLAPTAREGAQFTFIVVLPLIVPLWLNTVFIERPHGTLATALSLFPPTAPLAMMTRIASGGVPSWQPLAGLVGLGVMAYAFVMLSARLFRADNLLSYNSLSWKRILEEVRGKAR